MNRAMPLLVGAVFVAAAAGITAAPPAQAALYSNCTQARQNGDCDIPSSSDKYQSKLDRDGDGIGCEC